MTLEEAAIILYDLDHIKSITDKETLKLITEALNIHDDALENGLLDYNYDLVESTKIFI